jgi:hypothetical protein
MIRVKRQSDDPDLGNAPAMAPKKWMVGRAVSIFVKRADKPLRAVEGPKRDYWESSGLFSHPYRFYAMKKSDHFPNGG